MLLLIHHSHSSNLTHTFLQLDFSLWFSCENYSIFRISSTLENCALTLSGSRMHTISRPFISVCACARARVCMCVCVCMWYMRFTFVLIYYLRVYVIDAYICMPTVITQENFWVIPWCFSKKLIVLKQIARRQVVPVFWFHVLSPKR